MIGTMLLIGAAIVGGGLIATFWRQIVDWMKRVLEKLKTLVQGAVAGFRIFFSKMQGVGKEISKNYAKVGTKWQETVVERTVEISEIPEEYLQKMTTIEKEYEFTEELEKQLAH